MTDELKRKIDYICDSMPQLPKTLVMEIAKLKDDVDCLDMMEICRGAYDLVMTLEGTSMENIIKEVEAVEKEG